MCATSHHTSIALSKDKDVDTSKISAVLNLSTLFHQILNLIELLKRICILKTLLVMDCNNNNNHLQIIHFQNLVKRMADGFEYINARHCFQRSIMSLFEVITRKETSIKRATCYAVEPLPHVCAV